MNRLKLGIPVFFFILFSIIPISAQDLDYCGTEDSEIDIEWIRQFAKNKSMYSNYRDCQVYVPLTVHILGDDNGIGYQQVTSLFGALNTLNEDYDSTGIKFFLAGPFNYINNTDWYDHSSFSVGNQMMNANNVANTINCYIVDNAAGACGYRSFGGDAVVMAKSCNGPNDHTWAHEIGHYFSLPHTFRGWEGTTYNGSEDTPLTVGTANVEFADGSNCENSGDFFCDTPADYLSYRWSCDNNRESEIEQKDPMGDEFKSDGSLIMSYAADNCVSRFSPDQRMAMCSYLDEVRPSLISQSTPLPDVDPLQTQLIYPINGEIVENSVTLEWEENGTASFYIVEVSRIPSMSILSLRELVYGNSLEILGLNDDKTYYWRVRAFNNYDYDYDQLTETETFETGSLSSTDEFYEKSLRIFPNPLSGNETLNIEIDSPITDELSIFLFSMEGKIVHSEKTFVRSGTNNMQILSSNLPSGIYYLQASGQAHNFRKKLIIQ